MWLRWALPCGVRTPECEGSVVVARGLSCPTACGILLLRPGFEPASPALESGFLTTGPPGKSQDKCSYKKDSTELSSPCHHVRTQ